MKLFKRFFTFFFAILSLGVFLPSLAVAYIGLCCAHCGGNMPLNIPGGGIPETHEFRFKLNQKFMQMGPLRDGTDDVDRTSILGAPPAGKFAAVPDEMRMYMTMFGGAYSFTDDFALMVMGMYMQNDMDMAFNGVLVGATGTNGFTMSSSGFGDTQILGKYRLYSNDTFAPTRQVSLLAGLSLPSGSITKKFSNNPAAGQNGTILPYRMQLGSGTVDPVVGLTYQGSKDPWWYGLNAIYEGHWYDNDQGYHQGQELRTDLYVMRQVHSKVVLESQLNFKYEGQYSDQPYNQRVLGQGHFQGNPANGFLSPLNDPDNYGGEKLSATFGAQFQPFPLQVLELQASLPIYQNLNGPQLRDDFTIMAAWYIEIPTKKSKRFVGTKAPKELGF